MYGRAIVVQCFNKPDTLGGLLSSLLRCRRRDMFDLWIWMDHWAGSLREQDFKEKWSEVRSACEEFSRQYAGEFRSLTLRSNETNCGPYKTCKMAIDAAFAESELVVFTEDDTVFAVDALEWFHNGFEHGVLDAEGNWAISGESIFFDSRRRTVTSEFIEQAKAFAEAQGYFDKFVRLQFLPSTCFATNAARWAEFGTTRGLVIGDVEVNKRCASEKKFCVFPVVPRVADIGMLHPHGLSVTIHGAGGVQEIKRTYLMSDALSGRPHFKLKPMPDGEVGALFHRSVDLAGFG